MFVSFEKTAGKYTEMDAHCCPGISLTKLNTQILEDVLYMGSMCVRVCVCVCVRARVCSCMFLHVITEKG